MSQDIADMPGIEAAMERFNAVLADGQQPAANANGSDATSGAGARTHASGQPSTATRETIKADAQPAEKPLPHGRGSDGTARNSVTNPTDTRATTETPTANDNQQSSSAKAAEDRRDEKGRFTAKDTPEEAAKGGAGASRYAKAQERLDKTWENVNKRKTELEAQAQQVEQQRLTLERDKAQFEAIRRQAEQPQVTPEQTLQAAGMRRRDADALRMQARRAADSGRADEAQRLNKQADKADGLADDLAEYAEQLRRNPPLSMQQRQQQFDQARKGWTLEACKAFPDLEKDGSRLQQLVAQHLNALSRQDPQLLVHPSLIYHVARLSDSQIKTADLQAVAARVPVLEKEAESLRARIKELEADTTPASNGSVPKLNGEPKDDYASLRQSAAEVGPMFR